jgi:NhaP-type Na+/H+ or K+/H+ antiporter
MAVFAAGVCLANGHEPISRFQPQALARVMHPFNTAAELTVLLLLGLLVKPSELLSVLPVAVLLALVLTLARWAGVGAVLPARSFPRRERLIVTGFGLRGAVPLALAVSMAEELPHLRGLTAATAETLAPRLVALIFAVVLIHLLLQSFLMRGLLPGGDAGAASMAAARHRPLK